MSARKTIALIAHDNLKPSLIEWVKAHEAELRKHNLCGTGTTAGLVEKETGLPTVKYKSGPLGGDQQIGAKVAEGAIQLVIFFWDPMSPHPHDVDVKALLRIAALYDVPIACNRASADLFMRGLR